MYYPIWDAPPQTPQDQKKSPRRIVGVGNGGRTKGKANYVLYNLATDKVMFTTISY